MQKRQLQVRGYDYYLASQPPQENWEKEHRSQFQRMQEQLEMNKLVDSFLRDYGGSFPSIREIDDWCRIGRGLKPSDPNPYWFCNVFDLCFPHKRLGVIPRETLLNVDAIVSLLP